MLVLMVPGPYKEGVGAFFVTCDLFFFSVGFATKVKYIVIMIAVVLTVVVYCYKGTQLTFRCKSVEPDHLPEVIYLFVVGALVQD